MSPSDDHLPLQRFPHLRLVKNTPKGRGVFAGQPIPSGTTIDISPVLVLSATENKAHIENTELYHYTYNWPLAAASSSSPTSELPEPTHTQAIVFGLGSMFNHSTLGQNIGWKRDLESEVIVYWALRDIRVGEELCISYGHALTFEDVEKGEVGKEEERAEDVLGRIGIGVEEEDDG